MYEDSLKHSLAVARKMVEIAKIKDLSIGKKFIIMEKMIQGMILCV